MRFKVKKLLEGNPVLIAAVLAVVLLLICLCIGFTGISEKITTETPVRGIYEKTVSLQGVFIRQETVLKSSTRYFTVNAEDGAAVSTGDVLGISYDSADARDCAERMSVLRREIALAEDALKEAAVSKDSSDTENERASLQDLSADIASHNTDSLNGDLLRVQSVILAGGEDITRLQLLDMRSELEKLTQQQSGVTQELTSPAGGLFSQTVDGYESLLPASFGTVTVSLVQSAMTSHGTTEAKAYGKLISSEDWYFAALVTEKEASLLPVGSSAVLELSGYMAGRKQVSVVSVSAPENGECAVLLSGSGDLTDMLPLRFAACDAIIERVSGLRISREALRYAEDGETAFVFVVRDGKAVSVPVTVLAQEGDDVLIGNADGLDTGTRIVTGDDVFENMKIQ